MVMSCNLGRAPDIATVGTLFKVFSYEAVPLSRFSIDILLRIILSLIRVGPFVTDSSYRSIRQVKIFDAIPCFALGAQISSLLFFI